MVFLRVLCPDFAVWDGASPIDSRDKRLNTTTRNSASRQMPKEKKGEGFHSAAGLIRYFDQEDEKALKVNPWLVVGLCIAVSIVVLLLGALYPT